MEHKDLHELCDTLMDAIHDANEKTRGSKLTVADAEYIDRLTHALKSVKAVLAMGGHSGSKDNAMVRELRKLMQEATDERTKHEFQDFIGKIEAM